MTVKFVLSRYESEYKIKNILQKVNNIYSVKITSVKPLVIEVSNSYSNKVSEILERENVKYSRK